MDTRKVTLIATIAAILLLAVGIGYAYTAVTTNENNSASQEFIKLSQSGAGAYTFTQVKSVVYWDEEDKKDSSDASTPFHTTYKLSAETSTVDAPNNAQQSPQKTTYTVVKVGDTLTLNAIQESGTTDTAKAAGVKVELPSTDGVLFALPAALGTTEAAIFLKVTVATTAPTEYLFKLTAANTFTQVSADGSSFVTGDDSNKFLLPADTGANYKTATVDVLYGYAGTDGVVYKRANASTAVDGPSTVPFSGAKLVFKITETGANPAFE